jgi:cell division protease FtsH
LRPSAGAADDLQKIADIARSMVLHHGMVETFGQVTFEQRRRSFLGDGMPDLGPRESSEETAREVRCAVRELTDRARDRALAILRLNRERLDEGAERLLQTETMLAAAIPSVEHLPDEVAASDL